MRVLHKYVCQSTDIKSSPHIREKELTAKRASKCTKRRFHDVRLAEPAGLTFSGYFFRLHCQDGVNYSES